MRLFIWLLRAACIVLGALSGLVVVGLPGFDVVETIDGFPVFGGKIHPEQIATYIDEGMETVSRVDFYGFILPGEPFFWMIGIIGLLSFAGYYIGGRVGHRLFRSDP